MPFNLTGYKIFIASPGGLGQERKWFKNTIDEYNNIEAIPKGVIFQAIGWEDIIGGMGRPQSIINDELRDCDYCIVVLHDRWGSHPSENEKNATSGTEEEYKIALECFNNKDCPMKQICVFFKAVPPNQLSDPGDELKKVLNFKKELESQRTLLYNTFSSRNEFKKLI